MGVMGKGYVALVWWMESGADTAGAAMLGKEEKDTIGGGGGTGGFSRISGRTGAENSIFKRDNKRSQITEINDKNEEIKINE